MNLTQLPGPVGRLKTPEELDALVQKQLGAGLEAGAKFLEQIIRQTISVPAPLTVSPSGRGVRRVVRAATPARPGAPPRLVTGRLRSGVFSRMVDETTAEVGVVGVPYAARLENTNHEFVYPAIVREINRMSAIVGSALRAEGRS